MTHVFSRLKRMRYGPFEIDWQQAEPGSAFPCNQINGRIAQAQRSMALQKHGECVSTVMTYSYCMCMHYLCDFASSSGLHYSQIRRFAIFEKDQRAFANLDRSANTRCKFELSHDSTMKYYCDLILIQFEIDCLHQQVGPKLVY